MIRILRDGDFYSLIHKNIAIAGSIYRVVWAMREFGISYIDIEHGIIELERRGHNLADYDAKGRYVGTRFVTSLSDFE